MDNFWLFQDFLPPSWLSTINKRPMGHIAHQRKQFNSINTNDYLNVNWEKKKTVIYFMRIEWFYFWIYLNPLRQMLLCAKFGWNWPRGSEEDFQISSMYFPYFVVIPPWKREGPFIWTNLNSLNPSLVEIGSVEPLAQVS